MVICLLAISSGIGPSKAGTIQISKIHQRQYFGPPTAGKIPIFKNNFYFKTISFRRTVGWLAAEIWSFDRRENANFQIWNIFPNTVGWLAAVFWSFDCRRDLNLMLDRRHWVRSKIQIFKIVCSYIIRFLYILVLRLQKKCKIIRDVKLSASMEP